MDNTPFIVELPEALVTKELWLAAQTGGYKMRADDTRPHLLEELVSCPNCGKALIFPNSAESMGKASCPEAHGVRYSTAALEKTVLALLVDHVIKAASDEFRKTHSLELDLANAENLALRAGVEAKIAGVEKQILNTYRNSLQLDPQSMKYAEIIVSEFREKKDALSMELAAMPELLGLLIADEPAAAGLRDELADIAQRAPFRANTPDDEILMKRIRDLVAGVVLVSRDDGSFDVEVTVRTINQSLDRSVRYLAKSQILTVRTVNQAQRFEEFGDVIDNFDGRLTDAEWLSMPNFRGMNFALPEARDGIDAALIWSALGISHYSIMRHWGHEHRRCNIPGLMLNQRDERLIEHLRKTRGADFDMRLADPTPRGSENERLRNVRHPLLLLPICQQGSDVTELDAAQLSVVADVLGHLRHHKYGFESARQALTCYFRLVRSEYGRNQITLVGGTERHHRYVQHLHDSGLMEKITRGLLALEGFVIPDGYSMPTPTRGQLRTKTSIPQTDDVIRYLSDVFGLQAAPDRAPRVTRKLRLGTIIVDTELFSAWTSEGEVVPLTMMLMRTLIFLMEHPNKILSADAINRGARGIGDEVKADFTKDGSALVNSVRRVLKKHCEVAGKAIKTLSNWRAVGNYMLTETPFLVEGSADRGPIAFVPLKDPPKLVQAIVTSLKETALSEPGVEALEFLFNGTTKSVAMRGSLAYRMTFIRRRLQSHFPTNKNPIDRLAYTTRRYDDAGLYCDTTYTLRGLGRAVRDTLVRDGVISLGHQL